LLFLTTTDFFDNICKQSSDGTTQRIRLQKDKFFNYEISLPDIQDQRILIKKLKELEFNKIELAVELNHQLDLVKQLRQSFLREAMQGKLTGTQVGNEENQETGQQLLEKIKAEKAQLIKDKKLKKEKELPPIKSEEIPFEIPEDWVWCRLGEVIELLTDYHANGAYEKLKDNVELLDVESYAIILRTTNFHERSMYNYKYISEDAYNFLEKSKVYPGDIVMNKIGDPGKVFYVEERGKPMSLAMNLFLLRFRDNIANRFVYYYLIFQQEYIKTFVAGSTSLTITKDAVKELLFPLPPISVQNNILKKLETLLLESDYLEASIKQSQQQNEQLLQQVLREALEVGTKDGHVKEVKIINLPILQPEEDFYYQKRKALATYILNKSLTDPWLGDTKLMKLLHLADYHAIKRNLGQKFYQKAAGPFDNGFIYPFFKEIEIDGWFKRIKKDGRFYFSTGINYNLSLQTDTYFSQEELSSVNQVIAYFKKDNYERPEIVSTLYAVWNNRIIKEMPVSDELLKRDFLDWDPQKEKYRFRLDNELKWMRDKGIVPNGWGKVIERPK
jgi:type I restriction enzyme S subunit